MYGESLSIYMVNMCKSRDGFILIMSLLSVLFRRGINIRSVMISSLLVTENSLGKLWRLFGYFTTLTKLSPNEIYTNMNDEPDGSWKEEVVVGIGGLNYLLTYLLTYSMVQSPSWEANWFEASQEIPRISRYPKVHYRTHKRPPAVFILGHPNPVHISTSHLLKIHPNIIHTSTPRSPQWSLSLRFPHEEPIHPSPHPYAPHAQPISFFSILSPAQYSVRSTIHLAPRYAGIEGL